MVRESLTAQLMYSLQSESEGIATDLISFDTAHVTNSEYANCHTAVRRFKNSELCDFVIFF